MEDNTERKCFACDCDVKEHDRIDGYYMCLRCRKLLKEKTLYKCNICKHTRFLAPYEKGVTYIVIFASGCHECNYGRPI